MNRLIKEQIDTLQTQFAMKNNDDNTLLNSLGKAIQKIRLENEYNGEIKILQSFSRHNKTVYYTQPFQDDLDKLIKSKTTNKAVESNPNLIIHKLNESLKYLRTQHPKN